MKLDKNPVLSEACSFDRRFLAQRGASTDKDLLSLFVKNKRFQRNEDLFFPLNQNGKNNMIIRIAMALSAFGHISKMEVEKQYPINSYRFHGCSLRMLKSLSVNFIGDAVERCINEKLEYKPLKKGAATNYHLAKLLFRLGFLPKEEFEKVPKASSLVFVPSEEEIGEDGKKLLSSLDMEWDRELKEAITVAVTVSYRTRRRFGGIYNWPWKEITVTQLVRTFVRIKKGEPFFKKGGHIAWQWKYYDTDKLKLVMLRTEDVLKKLNYLE